MTTKVAIVSLGITQQDKDDVIGKLTSVTNLPMHCTVFDLLSMKDAIGIQMAENKVGADLILFYFHLDPAGARQSALFNMAFPVFGFLGYQDLLFSRSRVPVIVLPKNPDLVMIHADLVASLRVRGANAYLATTLDEVVRRIRAIEHVPILANKKVLVFGRPFKSTALAFPKLTKADVKQRTGVEVEFRPLKSLIKGIQTVDDQEAKKEMDGWIAEATQVDPALEKEILASCRVTVWLRKQIDEGGYSGISINCVSKHFPESPLMPHPCLAFSRLRDQGIAAVCEADVCALLTSLLMEDIADKPSYMGNIAAVDHGDSAVTLLHCVTGLKVRGYDREPLLYALRDYHDTGKGVVPDVNFDTGTRVTLGLFSKDLRSFVLWPGEIVDSGTGFCRNYARIGIHDTKRFQHAIAGCHYVMVYGNYVRELTDTLLDMNVSVIGPMQYN